MQFLHLRRKAPRRAAALALVAIVGAAGCARSPDAIAAATLEEDAYAQRSCAELAQLHLQSSQSLANLSALQREAQTADAVGVALLGLPLSSMSGNDRETAIAVEKGKLQAMERMQSRKRC